MSKKVGDIFDHEKEKRSLDLNEVREILNNPGDGNKN